MDYRDWGYDSRGPRERRSADDVRLQGWDHTGEISGLERSSGAHTGGDTGYSSYPSPSSHSGSSSAYSSGSVYRGRRRQQDDAVAHDRPYGRRSARTRWQQGEEDSTGTFSRYEEPDDRGGRHTGGWTSSAAPTSGWVGAASSGEWTREAYTGEWTRGDFTGEWDRETGEPIAPSRSDSARHGEQGGGRRRRATPDPREVPEQPSGYYDGRAAIPRQRDSLTETGEWIPPRGEQAGEGQAPRPRRPEWAVGLDPSTSGRRRRSWQDQTEARWQGTRSENDRTEESSRSWSISAPVSGLSGTSSWSGRAEVARREEPAGRWSAPGDESAGRWSAPRDARLAEDDPRWVGIPSSAPRSPAVAFPDEPGFDYDDRSAARPTPTTYPDDDLRGVGRLPGPAREDFPPARPVETPTEWRAPTATSGGGRGAARGTAATDWRPPTPTPDTARGTAATDWRPPTADPGLERGAARATATTDWRPPTTVPDAERGVARASTRAADWRPPAANAGREPGLGAAVRRVATPDELEDQYSPAPGGVFAAIVATLAWYVVPLILFAVYTLVQGEESQALGELSGGLTRLGAGLAVSLVVAVLVRWVSKTWRSISVGLAAAVVGGGLSTVLLSALSGQPLGG